MRSGIVLKRNLTNSIIAALALGFLVIPQVQAEENPEFSLDKVVVTALREESKDLTTPAYVHVLSNADLKATGAVNLMEALKFQEGFSYYSQSPQGHSNGGMSSRIVIRGVEKGTLVLLNGVPLNLNGWYQLDSIPLENIEKVEVVSGGGSVLYGSEAFGGVINIITKKNVENSYSTSFGSYGMQDHNLNLQVGKLSFSGQYSEMGTVKHITGINANSKDSTKPYYTNYDGNQRTNISTTYEFNPHLSLRYEHTEDHIDRSYHLASNDSLLPPGSGMAKNTALIHDDDQKNVFTALYQNNSLKMNAYYNQRKLYDENKLSTGVLNGAYTDTVSILGFDAQNSWQEGFGKVLVGINSQREDYEKVINNGTQSPVGPLTRDNYSVYLQTTHELDSRNTMILGARQQWFQPEDGKNRNEFLPQIQFLKRITENQSWFVDINKSFRMPTFTELYVTNSMLKANPNLTPETGWSYETGWKFKYSDADLKVALYYMDIDDKIAYVKPPSGTSQAQNFQNFKNMGIETRYEKRLNEHVSYQIGGSYSNPKQAGSDGVYSSVFNKLQLTGGVTYTQDRWTTNLYANYLALRAENLKPMMPVTLSVGYKTTPTSTIMLTIDNLLDRQDITTNDKVTATAPAYYALPRSFRLTYNSQF